MNFKIHHQKLGYIFIVIFLLAMYTTGNDACAAQQTKNVPDNGPSMSISAEEFNGQNERNGKPINLNEAIEMALKQNLELAAARKRFDEAVSQLIKASLLFPSNPRIDTEIGARDSREDRHTDYAVSLSQELEIFGQRQRRIHVAQKNLEVIKFQINNVEREITANVKSLFFQALAIQESVKLQCQAAEIFKRLWEATQERYAAGAVSFLELNAMQIQYGLAKHRLLAVKNDFRKTLLDLKLSLGQEKEKPLTIIGDLSYKPLQLKLDDILESSFKHRPDLKAFELEKERASGEIALRKAEIIPNPEISGFFSREEGTDDIVGGKVTISIPVWDRKQSERRRARTAKDIAEITTKNKSMQIQKEVESAYGSFTAAVESIEIFDNEIAHQVDENLKLNEISYKEGKINFIEFLIVQNNLIETKAAYLDALLNYNKAIINLETVVGMQLGLSD